MAKSKSSKQQPIHINPKKVGSLRKIAGVKKGQKIPVATLQKLANSPKASTRAKAQFALNMRNAKH